MSATNHTTTIELSQYISTDKPTYLTDYNGDMLKIDNAIAADRDSISTAQNKANTADGKADANKLSIDTLNAQINGDPRDPSDTGLAGKVTDIGGDVDTIESLIGSGTPTTSNQTIIGAVNGLEGAIAPREDGNDLANSYAEGEQFARGGSVYTALTSLTAGTAFASLTLNTDYKNSDTLVEQIADVAGDVSIVAAEVSGVSEILTGNFAIGSAHATITVTADGVKTWKELIGELHTAVNAKFAEYGWGIITNIHIDDYDVVPERELVVHNSTGVGSAEYFGMAYDTTKIDMICVRLHAAAGRYLFGEMASGGNTITDLANTVPTSGKTVTAEVRKLLTLESE